MLDNREITSFDTQLKKQEASLRQFYRKSGVRENCFYMSKSAHIMPRDISAEEREWAGLRNARYL